MTEAISDEVIHSQIKGMDLGQLALRLGRISRFTGEGAGCYSVLQHSIVVGMLVQDRLAEDDQPVMAVSAYLHDAAESVMGDVKGPLKTEEQSAVEDRVMMHLVEQLGVPMHVGPSHPIIKAADHDATVAEGRLLGISNPWFMEQELDEKAHHLTAMWYDSPIPIAASYFLATIQRLALVGDVERLESEVETLSERLNEKELSEMRSDPRVDDSGIELPVDLVESDGKITVDDPAAEVIDTADEFGEADFGLYEWEMGGGTPFLKHLFAAIEAARCFHGRGTMRDGEDAASMMGVAFPDEFRAVSRMHTEKGYFERLAAAYKRRAEQISKEQ